MPRDAFDTAIEGLSGALDLTDGSNGVVTLANVRASAPACHLLDYLRATGRIVGLNESYEQASRTGPALRSSEINPLVN